MCFFGGAPTPTAPPLPPEPPPPPTPIDPSVVKARQSNRRIAALAGGRSSTIATSKQGLETLAPGNKKSLLGL